jgi:mono/diheme cytochrome c family protein
MTSRTTWRVWYGSVASTWFVSARFGIEDTQMMRVWLRRIKMLAVSFAAVAVVASSGIAAQDAQGIYQQKCAACHGSSGMGDGPASATLQPPPEPFPKALKDKSDAWIAKVIKDGGPSVGLSPMMPAQPSLSDDQVKALAQYVKSLGH